MPKSHDHTLETGSILCQISSLYHELVANAGEDQGSKLLVDCFMLQSRFCPSSSSIGDYSSPEHSLHHEDFWIADKSKIVLAPGQSPLVALTNYLCLELHLKSKDLFQPRGMFMQMRQGYLGLEPSCGEHQMAQNT